MRDLADEHNVAVGVVLHDLNQTAAVADHIILLHKGHIRASGAADEVFTEAALSETYGISIQVTRDPATGRLTTMPVGRHNQRTRVRA